MEGKQLKTFRISDDEVTVSDPFCSTHFVQVFKMATVVDFEKLHCVVHALHLGHLDHYLIFKAIANNSKFARWQKRAASQAAQHCVAALWRKFSISKVNLTWAIVR